jgi:hypothetical protein
MPKAITLRPLLYNISFLAIIAVAAALAAFGR